MTKLRAGVPDARDAFVRAAPGKVTFPWEDPRVRDDVMIQLNCKIPEPIMLQLDYLAHERRVTKRVLIETALREYLQSEIAVRGE